MILNGHFTLNSVFGQVQVQHLFILLYGQRHGIYGHGDGRKRYEGASFEPLTAMIGPTGRSVARRMQPCVQFVYTSDLLRDFTRERDLGDSELAYWHVYVLEICTKLLMA